MKDPNIKIVYTGTDGTVGFIYAWDSEMKSAGKGEQEIIQITEDRIDYELRFVKPFKATDYAYMVFDESGDDQTNVKWGFNGKMKYPMNLMMLGMDMDKMLGKDLEMGLNNLKRILENDEAMSSK